jgi:DNA-directed RNA polymerase specialized sigma24 family protein
MLGLFAVNGKDRERNKGSMENEGQLLRSARRLNEEALLAIFDNYAPKVYVRALNQGHDPEQADNVVREVFLGLLDEFSEGKGPKKDLEAYLYRSADHFITDP